MCVTRLIPIIRMASCRFEDWFHDGGGGGGNDDDREWKASACVCERGREVWWWFCSFRRVWKKTQNFNFLSSHVWICLFDDVVGVIFVLHLLCAICRRDEAWLYHLYNLVSALLVYYVFFSHLCAHNWERERLSGTFLTKLPESTAWNQIQAISCNIVEIPVHIFWHEHTHTKKLRN